MISSLVHHVRPEDGLIEKGPKHVVCLLTPYTLIKFCLCFDLPTLYQLSYSNNNSDGGTAVGNYAAGNCAGRLSLLHTEMSCHDDPSSVM